MDASGWSGTDPVADFREINAELAAYNPALAQRPQIVAANKLDLPMATEHVPRLAAAAADLGAPFFAISGATRQGIRPMLQTVAARLHELWQELAPTAVVLPEVTGPGLDDVSDVSRDPDGAWRVAGRTVERTVAMTDLENDEALAVASAALLSARRDRGPQQGRRADGRHGPRRLRRIGVGRPRYDRAGHLGAAYRRRAETWPVVGRSNGVSAAGERESSRPRATNAR